MGAAADAVWLDWTRAAHGHAAAPGADPGSRAGARPDPRARALGGRDAARSWRSGPTGRCVLPEPATARGFRLEILDARFPPGTDGRQRQRRAVGIGELRGPGVPSAPPTRGGGAARDVRRRERGGRARDACASSPAAPSPTSTPGRPLRARACGVPVALPAGEQRLTAAPGVFAPYLLRLRSPAPRPAAPPTGGGRVLDPGSAGRGEHDGVRVALSGPSWLVLGESYNRGWRATCDGDSLGAPQVIDGFANGWPAPASCRSVRFWFGPNQPVYWGYALSALACLLLLGLLLLRRPGPAAPAGPVPIALAPDRPARWPLRRALGAGLIVGVALGFLFAIRAGVVIAPAVAFVLWRGIGARVLIAAAAGLLAVVVPLLYLAFPAEDQGGYNVQYAVDHIAPHWFGVAAWVLLALALVRTISTARARGAGAPRSGP